MAKKFQLGEKVKVIHADSDTEMFLGKTGVVSKVDPYSTPSFGVQFDDTNWNVYFYEIELEKV